MTQSLIGIGVYSISEVHRLTSIIKKTNSIPHHLPARQP